MELILYFSRYNLMIPSIITQTSLRWITINWLIFHSSYRTSFIFRIRMKLLGYLVFVILILECTIRCQGVAVMSIDFGTEWMKVAIVSVSNILMVNFLLGKWIQAIEFLNLYNIELIGMLLVMLMFRSMISSTPLVLVMIE